MNRTRVLDLFLLLLAVLTASACATAPQATATAVPPSPAVQAAATATLAPTTTPRSSPTAVPTDPPLTPTSAPTSLPKAQTILNEALAAMSALDSFRTAAVVNTFISEGGASIKETAHIDTAFQAPDRLSGTVTTTAVGADTEVSFVLIGEEVYVREGAGGDWIRGDARFLDTPGLETQKGFILGLTTSQFIDLFVLREETVDGAPAVRLQGVIDPFRFGDRDLFLFDPGQADFWIGVEDGLLHRAKLVLEGTSQDTVTEFGADAQLRLVLEVDYRDFNAPQQIAAPDVAQRYTPLAALPLDLYYELPTGWTVAEWGEPGCTEVNCSGLRLTSNGGTGESLLAISRSSAEAAEAARAAASGCPLSEQTTLSGLPVWWCVGETGGGGFVFLPDGAVVEVRGRWPQGSVGGAIAAAVAGSLTPLDPAAATRRLDVPGWLAADVPQDWHLVQGHYPGELLLSTRNAPLYSYDLTEEDAVVLLAEIGLPWQSALDTLQDVALADLPPDCVMIRPATAITLNGYDAATAIYSCAGIYDGRLLEQVVIVEGPDRNIGLWFTTRDRALAAHQNSFTAVLDTLDVRGPLPAPLLFSGDAIPPGYGTHVEESMNLMLSVPPGWEVFTEQGVLVAEGPAAQVILEDAGDLATYVDQGDIEALFWLAQEVSWANSLPGTQFVSDLTTFINADGQEFGLIRVALPDGHSGVSAVLRQGDQVVLALAGSADFAAWEEELLAILSSIKLEDRPRPTAG